MEATISPAQTPPALRPLDIGGVLDVSIKLVRNNFAELAKIVILFVIPFQIAIVALNESATNGGASAITAGLLVVVLGVAQALFVYLGCFEIVANAYLNKPIAWKSSLRLAARKALPVIGMSLLAVVPLIIAYILLIIPGIWLQVAWSMAIPAIMLENKGPMDSLGRSFQLVKDRWWATFGALLVGYILVGIISYLLNAIAAGIAIGIDSDTSAIYFIILAIAGVLVALVTTPFIMALLTVIYFDLRVRKEGFDLTLLAQSLGTEAPSTPPAFVPVETGPAAQTPSVPSVPTQGSPPPPSGPDNPPPPPPPPPA